MVTKVVQTPSLFICFFLYTEINFLSNIMINTEYYIYSVTLHTRASILYLIVQIDKIHMMTSGKNRVFPMINPKVILKILSVRHHLMQNLSVMKERLRCKNRN